jgi:hypothetical protein
MLIDVENVDVVQNENNFAPSTAGFSDGTYDGTGNFAS